MKDKNHIIFSTHAEKSFDKIQHTFKTKDMTILAIERMYLNILKATYDKPTANIIWNVEKLKAFYLGYATRQG